MCVSLSISVGGPGGVGASVESNREYVFTVVPMYAPINPIKHRTVKVTKLFDCLLIFFLGGKQELKLIELFYSLNQ